MADRLRRSLPWVAMAGGLMAAACLILLSTWRQDLLTDTGVGRASVELLLERLQALHPSSIDDSAFRTAVDEVAQDADVATLWLLTPKGEVVLATGATAASFSVGNAVELATEATKRLLATLPQEALGADQTTLLLVASAIQREGEHNDIYRHAVREIRGTDGKTIALLGVAYPVSLQAASPAWIAAVVVALIGIGIYWLALPAWTFLDAQMRRERAWAWAAFVLIGNLAALLAYLLVRWPKPTSAEFGRLEEP